MSERYSAPFTIAFIALSTIAASMIGTVLIPNSQLSRLEPVEVTLPDGTTTAYPQPLDSFHEAPGREHYRALGCIYCHSQQLRGEGFGADLERGWGSRRSIPLDYIYQDPPLTGTSRTGPDLASIGQRQPSEQWHYLHLFDPQITSEGSLMPPHRFLFDEMTSEGPDGIPLPEGYRDVPTWIKPKLSAVELVAYLKALKQDHRLEDVTQ